MAYERVNWENLPSKKTPVNADNLNKLNNAIDQNANNIGGKDYDATSTYDVGDIVKYQGQLYICTTAITTAEAWNSNHWQATDVLSKSEIYVGTEEPVAGEKVWFNKDKNSIYVRNSNGVYEKFIKKEDIAKVNIVSAKTGYTLMSQDIFKQGKHYWGYVVIKKDSGVFNEHEDRVANINIKSSSTVINYVCCLTNNLWASRYVGYLFVSQYNSKTGEYPIVIVNDANNSNSNYAKFFIDMIED